MYIAQSFETPKTRAPSRGWHSCVRCTQAFKLWGKSCVFSTFFLGWGVCLFLESSNINSNMLKHVKTPPALLSCFVLGSAVCNYCLLHVCLLVHFLLVKQDWFSTYTTLLPEICDFAAKFWASFCLNLARTFASTSRKLFLFKHYLAASFHIYSCELKQQLKQICTLSCFCEHSLARRRAFTRAR